MGTTDMALVLGERVTEWRYIRDTAFVLSAVGDTFTQMLSRVPEANYIYVQYMIPLCISRKLRSCRLKVMGNTFHPHQVCKI